MTPNKMLSQVGEMTPYIPGSGGGGYRCFTSAAGGKENHYYFLIVFLTCVYADIIITPPQH